MLLSWPIWKSWARDNFLKGGASDPAKQVVDVGSDRASLMRLATETEGLESLPYFFVLL